VPDSLGDAESLGVCVRVWLGVPEALGELEPERVPEND